MKFPIRINRNLLPVFLHKIIPSAYDTRGILGDEPNLLRFEQCVTAIKIDSVWRSTYKQRHPISNRLIKELLKDLDNPLIHEPAISAGSTSMDLIDTLEDRFGHYYATDLFTKLPYRQAGKVVFFYHPAEKRAIFRVSDIAVMYEDVVNAIFPLGYLATKYLAEAPAFDMADPHYVSMVNPRLLKLTKVNSKVSLSEYSLLNPWAGEPLHLVKIANVLNGTYFSDDKILMILENAADSLVNNGVIVLIDNRKIERVSILSKEKSGKLVIQKEVNGGAYAAQIAHRVRPNLNNAT